MSLSIHLLQAVALVDLLAVGLIVPLLSSHVRRLGANHIYVGALGSVYCGFQLGSGPLLDLLAVGLIVPLLSSHVRRLGANHIYVGALGSVYCGFQLGSGPLLGSLSDLKGRKTILIFTLLVCGATYAVMGLTTSLTLILVTRAILGVFKQTQMLSRALVPDYEKNEHKQSVIYGRMAAISGVGFTLGPIIGGHIVEDYPEQGFVIVAVAVGICFITNAGIVFLLPNTNRKMPTRRKDNDCQQCRNNQSSRVLHSIVNSMKQSVIELYKIKWSKFWDIFLLKILVGFAMGVYYSNYSFYLKSQYSLSPKYIGYVISFQGVVGSTASFFMGYINSFYSSDKDYSLRVLHVFLILSVSLLGLILSFNVYIYIIWLIPLAIGNAVGRLVTLEMILKRCDEDHRGTLIGASNSVRSLSGVVAPMVAGFISHYFGVSYVIYASFLSTLLGLILCNHFRNRKVKDD